MPAELPHSVRALEPSVMLLAFARKLIPPRLRRWYHRPSLSKPCRQGSFGDDASDIYEQASLQARNRALMRTRRSLRIWARVFTQHE
jgi:hypothetical protein